LCKVEQFIDELCTFAGETELSTDLVPLAWRTSEASRIEIQKAYGLMHLKLRRPHAYRRSHAYKRPRTYRRLHTFRRPHAYRKPHTCRRAEASCIGEGLPQSLSRKYGPFNILEKLGTARNDKMASLLCRDRMKWNVGFLGECG
jgi:hypothetical protein